MKWVVEYFERVDTTQPAEIFEDSLYKAQPKLSAKLYRLAKDLEVYGYNLGGGYLEKCYEYQGLWEIRAIHRGTLAREFCGFDKERIVLLHGYIKRSGQPASMHEMRQAFTYWKEYMQTRLVSPTQEEIDDKI